MRALVLLCAALAAARCGLAATCAAPKPNTDVTQPVRSAAYPNGLSGASQQQCCDACDKAPDCLAVVYDPRGTQCYPLAYYATLIAASDRVFAGAPPPPPPQPQPPPREWAPRIAARDMLFSGLPDTGIDASRLPMVGNGFLALQVMNPSIYVAGLFNGYLTKDPSHRVRLPATNSIAAPGIPSVAALDVREATYFRRSYLDPAPPGACTAAATRSCSNAPARIEIEQRWYAHRSRPSVLVHEVQILPPAGGGAALRAGAAADAPFAMLVLINRDGGASADIALAPAAGAPPGASLQCGSTHVGETNSSGLQSACVLTTDLPKTALLVPAAAPYAAFTFLTVVRTSIETPAGGLAAGAAADYGAAMAVAAGAGQLRAEHIAEWAATLWTSGFETDRPDLAYAVNSSLYAILSSVRNDREYGLSPGGLTAGYNGHR
jgi:hypothetical protein